MNSKIHLAPLDPSRELFAQRAFLCRGRNYRRGEKFNNSSVPLRTLRILYEGRAIGYPDEQRRPAVAVMVQKPARRVVVDADLVGLTKAALVAKLRDLGVTIDPRWLKPRLVEELIRFENASDR